MPKSPAQYRVVIFNPIDDPQAVKDVIAAEVGLHPTDVVQWLARAPGIWPRLLEEDEARRFLDCLYELGIPAEARRLDQFPELSPPRTVHRAACLPDGFRIEGLRSEPTHWIPWDRIELICAGRISTEDEFRDAKPPRWPSSVVTGFRAIALMKPRPVHRTARATRIPRDPSSEVVIVRRDPRIAFRVTEAHMNYAYLGDRLRESAAENFPLFLSDLCSHSTAAYITESTRSLLEHPESRDHEFSSSQDLLEHATLRLLWSWYRRDRDAQGQHKSSWNSDEHDRPTDTDLAPPEAEEESTED